MFKRGTVMEENGKTVGSSIEEAILSLRSEEECQAFLRDLLTPQEYRAVKERWEIVQLLDEASISYREISEKMGASVTTITRVARFLKDEPNQGYRLVLDRMKDK